MPSDLGPLLLDRKKRSLWPVALLDDQLKLFALVLFGLGNYAILLDLHLLGALGELGRAVVVGVLVVFMQDQGDVLGLGLGDGFVRGAFEDLVGDFLLAHGADFVQFGFLGQ
jgi:hypothetical protein